MAQKEKAKEKSRGRHVKIETTVIVSLIALVLGARSKWAWHATVASVGSVLEPGGHFHAATDWENYARQISGILEADNGFTNPSGSGEFYRGPVKRALTRFEKRGLRQGREVRELLYERI